MKITDVKLGILSVPLRVPFKTALRSVDSVEDIIVEIHTDTGHIGYGEAPPTGAVTGETQYSIIGAFKDHIIKTILGRDVDDFENLMMALAELKTQVQKQHATWPFGTSMDSYIKFLSTN